MQVFLWLPQVWTTPRTYANVGRSAASSDMNYTENICKCWEECVRWSKGWHMFIKACEAEGVVSAPAIVRCNNLINEIWKYKCPLAPDGWSSKCALVCFSFMVRNDHLFFFICDKKCPLVFRLLIVKYFSLFLFVVRSAHLYAMDRCIERVVANQVMEVVHHVGGGFSIWRIPLCKRGRQWCKFSW